MKKSLFVFSVVILAGSSIVAESQPKRERFAFGGQ